MCGAVAAPILTLKPFRGICSLGNRPRGIHDPTGIG